MIIIADSSVTLLLSMNVSGHGAGGVGNNTEISIMLFYKSIGCHYLECHGHFCTTYFKKDMEEVQRLTMQVIRGMENVRHLKQDREE